MAAALPAYAAGKPIEIWFQDEARVGQKGGHAYIWALVGSRPPMVRDNRHVSAYVFGAICPQRALGAGLIMPYANAYAMNEHLKEISRHVAVGAHALLLCDGAGWHQSGRKLQVPDNITVLAIPPYSPELNPMENVWQYLRNNKLASLVWESYEAIVDACVSAWNFLIDDPARIQSIGSREWERVSK
jgi:DDE superfamily endonuclease